MLERTFIVAIVLGAMVAADWRTFRKASGTGRFVYFLLSVAVVYCGILFVLGVPWTNYTDLLRLLFGGAARSVVGLVKTPT